MPSSWELLLQGYVKKTFYADTRRKSFADKPEFTEGDYRFFVEGVRDLSVAFTEDRAFLPKNYLNRKEFRSGYILYFLPVNALKVATLLGQAPKDSFVKDGKIEMTIVDVGSGPGTGMLGTMLFLERFLKDVTSVKLRWVLIDQNRQALNDAAAIHDLVLADVRKRYAKVDFSSELRLESRDLFAGKISRSVPSADLILCLNVLSELSLQRLRPLMQDLLGSALSPTGRMLVMEPAL
jgi:hypothetical protein